MDGGRRRDWTRGDERFWDGLGVEIEKFEKLTVGQKVGHVLQLSCVFSVTFVGVFGHFRWCFR